MKVGNDNANNINLTQSFFESGIHFDLFSLAVLPNMSWQDFAVGGGAGNLRPSAKAKAKGRGKTGVAAKPAAKPKPKAKGVAKASCKQRAKSRA